MLGLKHELHLVLSSVTSSIVRGVSHISNIAYHSLRNKKKFQGILKKAFILNICISWKYYTLKKQTNSTIKHTTQIAHRGHDLGLTLLSLTGKGCSRVNFVLQQNSGNNNREAGI